MYTMDDLLQLVHSDRADGLRLHVGQPPIVVINGAQRPVEGPAITPENAERLLQSVATTRQRRDLRERGWVDFLYRFRDLATFVVLARMEDENVGMDIQ
jgi:Tfp pilus assembly pilus retraction ATPase PilT